MRVKVCKESELKEGDSRVVSILAKRVAVFKLNGELFGMEGDCKHMKQSIAEGKIEGTVITCPHHGWRYDIPSGECLEESWAKLKTYVAYVEDGHVWVDVLS